MSESAAGVAVMPAGANQAVIAEGYERGGWPHPVGRFRPLTTLAGSVLPVPWIDGTWQWLPHPEPATLARQIGAEALRQGARAGFGTLVPFRRATDVRFGEIIVSASLNPHRIVVSGPALPTVTLTRTEAAEQSNWADPIGTRDPVALALTVHGQPGVIQPGPGGARRDGFDVVVAAWGRRYEFRQIGPDHAAVYRGEQRIARLLRGDPEPDRRYAVGWDAAADAVDRAIVYTVASAFRIGVPKRVRDRLRSANWR